MAQRNPGLMNRSGRIKANEILQGVPLPIVQGGGAYRIYNTGETRFTVLADAASAIPLKPKASIDVEATSIRIGRGGGGQVDGIYELIDPLKPIRTGRYKGEADANNDGIKLAHLRAQSFYRILNSGKVDFLIYLNSSNTPTATLAPRFSLDVAATSSLLIFRDDDEIVEAIYDYLDSQNLIRSGRFKINARHKIIDFANGPVRQAFYRIHNSGEVDFELFRNTGASFATLKPDQSYDFTVPGSGEREIWVAPPTATPTARIQGIYDMLKQST